MKYDNAWLGAANPEQGEVNYVDRSHRENKLNPHNVTKDQLGLGLVDNTADMDKPISDPAKSWVLGKIHLLSFVSPERIEQLIADIDKGFANTTTEINSLKTTKADKTDVQAKLDMKADSNQVYKTDELDGFLALKANANDVYTKAGVDSLVATKADKANVYIKSELYSKSEMDAKIASGELRGPKGDQGPKGDIGPQGPQGVIGPKGDKGDKGDTGSQGPVGPKGDKGNTGSRGLKGDTGAQGPVGPQGPKGDTGPKGDAGDPTVFIDDAAVATDKLWSSNKTNSELNTKANKNGNPAEKFKVADGVADDEAVALGQLKGDEWIDITTITTFQSNWANYAPSWKIVIKKLPNGTVFLRGLAKGGANGRAIFTLPAEYRPKYGEIFIVKVEGAKYHEIRINTNGDLYIAPDNFGTRDNLNQWVSLSLVWHTGV